MALIDTLKTQLFAAGCTMVRYENDQIANITADESLADDVIGMILEPNVIAFEVKGNSVQEREPVITVEILVQVKPEDTAEHNRTAMDNLKIVARKFIFNLVRSGQFAKIADVNATKVPESRYDANLIGWALALNLKYIENGLNC